MNLKTWLLIEKQDLDKKIRSYSRVKMLLLFLIIFGLFAAVFWLWGKTSFPKIKTFDAKIMVWISNFQTPSLRQFFSWITHLGSGLWIGTVFVFLALLLITRKRKKAVAIAGFTLAGCAFFIFFLKNFFARSRPIGCLPPGDCFAFPSGHAALSFYFYGLFAYLIFRFLPTSLKIFLTLSFFIGVLIFLIALSRLFFGFHYPSDLLAGFLLGGAWLLLAVLLIDVFC